MSMLEIVTQKGRRLMVQKSAVGMVCEADDLSSVGLVCAGGQVIVVEGESFDSVRERFLSDTFVPSPVRIHNADGLRVMPNGMPDRTRIHVS